MLSFFNKIKNLKFRKIGAKSAVIFLINRKLPTVVGKADLGKVTDLQLDRAAKHLTLEMTKGKDVNAIDIVGYKIILFKGKSFISWDCLNFHGKAKKQYQKIFKGISRLEVSPKLTTALKAIL